MNNKGFAETHTNIETPNDVDVAEKPLKTLKKRVDINILKSKRDDVIFKMKLASKEEVEILNKRIDQLEKKIENFLTTEIEWVPLTTVNLFGENKDNMIKLLETLDHDDDVQNIFTNAKFEN